MADLNEGNGGILRRILSAERKSRIPSCCLGCSERFPFYYAVEEGDVAEVNRILEHDPEWLRQPLGRDRLTAWHVAAQRGHVEVLKALVARTHRQDVVVAPLRGLSLRGGPQLQLPLSAEERVTELVTRRGGGGATPLILAASHDHHDAVRLLLSLGADPWQADYEGLNPLHHAGRAGATRAMQALLEAPKPASRRACSGNTNSTRYVDSVDACGFTALHYAVLHDKRTAMRVLFGFDANLIPRTTCSHGDYANLPPGATPLHVACQLGCLDRAKMLLRAYYETAADLLPSQTALLATVERRRRARSHPDPRLILTRSQRLPFHIAARCGHRHLLDWLDPSVPLMFLFGGEEEAAEGAGGEAGGGNAPLVGVSRLTVLAARALHAALLDSLAQAEVELKRHKEAKEAAREERRRRREERRQAREAAQAARSLKQGKEPPPDGIKGTLRRLLSRSTRDPGLLASGESRTHARRGSHSHSHSGVHGSPGDRRSKKHGSHGPSPLASPSKAESRGGSLAAAGGGTPPRSRQASGDGSGAAASGGGGGVASRRTSVEQHGASGGGGGVGVGGGFRAQPSPLGRPERSASASCVGGGGGDASVGGGGRRHRDGSGMAAGRIDENREWNGGENAEGGSGSGSDTPSSPETPDHGRRRLGGGGEDSGSISGSSLTSGVGGGVRDAPGGDGVSSDRDDRVSLTQTMLRRIYQATLGGQKQNSKSKSKEDKKKKKKKKKKAKGRKGKGGGGADGGESGGSPTGSQQRLNARLNRAGINIPGGPEDSVAYFSPGRGPMLDGMPRHIELPARGSLSQHPSPLPLSASAFARPSLASLPPTPSDLPPGAPPPCAAFPHQLPPNGVLLSQGSTDSSNFASAAGAIRIPLLPMGSGGLGGTMGGGGGGGGAAGVALLTEALGPLPPRRGSSNDSTAVPPLAEPRTGQVVAGGDGGAPAGDPGGNGGGSARRRPPPLVVVAPASGMSREEGGGSTGPQDAAGAATGAVAQSDQAVGAAPGEAGATAAVAGTAMRRPPHLPPLPPPPQQRPKGASSSSSLGATSGSGGGSGGALSASGSRKERVSGSGACGGSDAASEEERTSAGAQPQRLSNSGGVRSGHVPLPPLPPLLIRGPSGGTSGSAHPLPPLAPSSSSLRARGSDHSGPTTPTLLNPTPGGAFPTQPAPTPGASTPFAQAAAGDSPVPGTSVSLSLSLGDPARPLLRLPGAADLNSPAGTPSGAVRADAPAGLVADRRSPLGQSLPLDVDSVPLLREGSAEADAAATLEQNGDAAPGVSTREGGGARGLLQSLRHTLQGKGRSKRKVQPVDRSPRSSPLRNHNLRSRDREEQGQGHGRGRPADDTSRGAAGGNGDAEEEGDEANDQGSEQGDDTAQPDTPTRHRASPLGREHHALQQQQQQQTGGPQQPHPGRNGGLRVSVGLLQAAAGGHNHNAHRRGSSSAAAAAASGGSQLGSPPPGGISPVVFPRARRGRRPRSTLSPATAAGGGDEYDEYEVEDDVIDNGIDAPDAGAGAVPRGGGGGVTPRPGSALARVRAEAEAEANGASFTSSAGMSSVHDGDGDCDDRDAAKAGGGGAGGADEEDVCPVCLEDAPNLLAQNCNHTICMDCARDLVKRNSLTPALCPCCRRIISSFKARLL